MPFTSTSTCPQCRLADADRFVLERHTVFVCASCGCSWTAPPPDAGQGLRAPEQLAEARERLRAALLRFLRPWIYANSGGEPGMRGAG